MLDSIHIFISLFAAVVMTIAGIIEGIELPLMVMRLIITIVIFWLIGLVVRAYLKRNVFPPTNEPVADENADSENEEDTEQSEDESELAPTTDDVND